MCSITHYTNKITAALILGLAISQLNTNIAMAKKPQLEGPVPARLERVIDGDTIIVKVKIWLDQELTVLVRLSGINAPELKSRNPNYRQLAARATKVLRQTITGHQLTLRNIRRGKYAGRVIADVYVDNRLNLSNYLLEHGLAIPYGLRFKTGHQCSQIDCAPSRLKFIDNKPNR